jgi:hypothetical protein
MPRTPSRKRPPHTARTKSITPSESTDDISKGPRYARTVIYVHGIGNKPTQSVLKCQWDTALLGFDIGERSRGRCIARMT